MDATVIERCDICIEVAEPEKIAEFHLTRVKPGFAKEIFGLFLKGRITPAADGLRSIDFLVGRTKLDRCVLARPAAGADGSPNAPGAGGAVDFEMALNLLGAPAVSDISMTAVFKRSGHVPLGKLSIRRARLATGYEPRYNPIIVNSMGRSGTTLFMRLLSMHPAIFVHQEYPYELMAAHYWFVFLESITTPLAGERLVNKWEMRDLDMKRMSSHPYYRLGAAPGCARYLGGKYARLVAAFCQQAIDELYGGLINGAKTAGSRPATGETRYFSEKSLPFPEMIKELYPGAREIFLMRDVRDSVCSALAFNQKRGTQAFGREGAGSDADFAANRAREFQSLFDASAMAGNTSCIVRYEDLIGDPGGTATRVLEYLGVESSAGLVAGMIDRAFAPDSQLEFHRTTASPQASIGRWKRELSPQLREVCRSHAGHALDGLGYPG